MKWLRDQLQLFENTKDTQGMAESVENTNGVYIVPVSYTHLDVYKRQGKLFQRYNDRSLGNDGNSYDKTF